MNGIKFCSKCNSDKSTNNFCKASSTTDGLQFYCRSCTREANRISYAKKHPNYQPRRKGRDIENKKAYHEQWRRDKRDIELVYERNWRARNPEANRLRHHQRMARLNHAKGFATSEQIKQRIDYYGWRCAYCGGSFEQLDHVIPISKGGTNWPANLRPCCSRCNAKKGQKYWKDWLLSI